MKENVQNIYEQIIAEIEQIMGAVDGINIHTDKLKKYEQQTLNMLCDLKNRSVEKLEALSKTAVWDRMIYVFYGETNSGKSTTVEALRIALGEASKVEQRAHFDKLNRAYIKVADEFEGYEKKLVEKHNKSLSKCEAKLKRHRKFMVRASHSWFYRLLNTLRIKLGGLPAPYGEKREKRLIAKHKQLTGFNPIDHDKRGVKLKREIKSYVDQLTPLQDGEIIGFGGQDFTNRSFEYAIQLEDRPITLVDLPGIEGQEKEIEVDIQQAMSKAHCIYYVLNGDKLPERRTLDKIKHHLSDQGEVYVLLNCRGNNYFIEDQPTSLFDLHAGLTHMKSLIDEQMGTILGDSYRGVVPIQALLAFYDKANFIRNTNSWRRQHKLKNKLQDSLWELSNGSELVAHMREFTTHFEEKIARANTVKGISRIFSLADTLDEVRSTYYSDFELKALEKMYVKFAANADLAVEYFKTSLQKVAREEVNGAINRLRSELAVEIKRYINQPDVLKIMIKKVLNGSDKMVGEHLKQAMIPALEDLKEQVMKNVEDFKDDIELFSKYTSFERRGFDMDFGGEFRSSMQEQLVHYVTFVGTLLTFGSLGTLLGSWVPVVGNLIGGVLGSVLGVAVAAWNWVKGEKKETKAMRRLESSLRNEVKPQLELYIEGAINQIESRVEEQVDKIKVDIKGEIGSLKRIISLLEDRAAQLRMKGDELQLEVTTKSESNEDNSVVEA